MARFVCPACSNKELTIILSLELPPGPEDDELTLQAVECGRCAFGGIAVYRESRRGALDSESWYHTGYELEPHDLVKIQKAIASCASPDDRRCECKAHKSLAGMDWAAPARAFTVKRQFNMDLL